MASVWDHLGRRDGPSVYVGLEIPSSLCRLSEKCHAVRSSPASLNCLPPFLYRSLSTVYADVWWQKMLRFVILFLITLSMCVCVLCISVAKHQSTRISQRFMQYLPFSSLRLFSIYRTPQYTVQSTCSLKRLNVNRKKKREEIEKVSNCRKKRDTQTIRKRENAHKSRYLSK